MADLSPMKMWITHATVVVIGMDIVDELFDGSTADALGSKLRIGNNLYQVVGVLESTGGTAMGSSDNQVYVPISTAQSRLITRSSAYEEVNLISVSAVNSEVMDDAMDEITKYSACTAISITGDDENDFEVFSQETFTEAAASNHRCVDGVSGRHCGDFPAGGRDRHHEYHAGIGH